VRNLLVATGLFVASLTAGPAEAAVDLNGPWHLEVQAQLLTSFACLVQIVQTGTAISVDGSLCQIAFTASGTIDVDTGAFTGAGTSDPTLCPTLSLSGTASAASDAFAGTLLCSGGVFPASGTFQGSRCGNGITDPGEQCDDGNVNDFDCCSPTCTFDPSTFTCGAGDCATGQCNGAGTCVATPKASGTTCGSDGIDCTNDVCDGAGACTHPSKPAGATCLGDFNPCTDGACDGGTTCVLTNNTAPCDDFNACTLGDVCSGGTCVPGSPGPAGVECELDGDLCTLEACDASGACLATGGCSDCCGGPGCTVDLADCKSPTVPGAKLQLRHVNGARDKLLFLWKRGEMTDLGELGTPLTSTDYSMCVYFEPYPYDGSIALDYRATAPAGGTCDGTPCWHEVATRGFAYKDRARTPDGLEIVKLKSGAAGAASVLVRGKGPNLGFSIFGDGTGAGLGTPTVQIRSSDATCFQATFPTSIRNGPYEFRSSAGE
jgi:cysteine-rich repeat protein